MDCKCGIYKIVNIIDEKCYIGQSKNIAERKARHVLDLSKNRHCNKHLQNAYNKYGKDNFEFSVVLYCEPFELTRYEQAIVDITSNIYNLCLECVSTPAGRIVSIEERNNISKRNMGNKYNLGKKLSEETKIKISDNNKGKHAHTEEQLLANSLAHLGKPGYWQGKHLSEETKNKLSEIRKGRPSPLRGTHISEEFKKHLSEINMGKKPSDETRKKMSDSQKNRPPMSEETKNKISNSNRGKVRSAETKKHLSEINTGKTISTEIRQKISSTQLGKKHNETWKLHQSEGYHRGRLAREQDAILKSERQET
jgi:group I intron endonuclease